MELILTELQLRLHDHPDILQSLGLLGLEVLLLVWMDDMALAICSPTSRALPDLLSQLVALVRSVFADFGLRLNYAVGKTAIV